VLKAAAERNLKPDVHCNEVFEEVVKTAGKEGIRFWQEVGIGHGVGVSDREAPYLNRYDKTLLKPGMVLVLDIYTYGPRRELIHSKDTYEIVEDGCRRLSWYRSWDGLYAVTGLRGTH
ncbi:MAG: M24 family metallopeptidase, partial [Deltaproteobacteria bacterium]|nr:M24 family metallopeptidase [Deltaproteobacteria bacterium]